MLLKHIIKTAFTGLKTNRSRSALTILGIVIGITAIMLVMSVGQGAEQLILNEVRSLGSETIIIEPGREPKGPTDFVEIFTDSLKARDVEALQKEANVQALAGLEPVVFQSITMSFENETRRAIVRGGTDFLLKILDLQLASGSFLTAEDVKQRANVVVLGSEVAKDLFGSRPAVGNKIKIKGRIFRVVGVLAPRGPAAFFDADNIAMVPYTTAQQYLIGKNYYNAIIVQAASEAAVPQVVRDIEATLRETHGITDPEKDDFHVTTQEDIVERIGLISLVLSMLLVSVAAISLVVGGIGIMNIMLVSVTERTSEIGLRKALGATDKDVMCQFLAEAVMLTAIGGVVGIALGTLLSLIAAFILSNFVGLNWYFVFPLQAALLGLAVSAAIGLGFGLYPAKQAAKKSPIEALRYE